MQLPCTFATVAVLAALCIPPTLLASCSTSECSDACSGGTVHADGFRIDTSSNTVESARHLGVALALAPVVALLVLTIWLFVRRRGRRNTMSA